MEGLHLCKFPCNKQTKSFELGCCKGKINYAFQNDAPVSTSGLPTKVDINLGAPCGCDQLEKSCEFLPPSETQSSSGPKIRVSLVAKQTQKMTIPLKISGVFDVKIVELLLSGKWFRFLWWFDLIPTENACQD